MPNLILFEQNPDEGQWISGAGTLLRDFRFWLSFDGTTNGPLIYFPLLLITVFGGSLNYATVRLFGLLFCAIPSVIFIYLAFKYFFDEKISRIIVLPLIPCLSFMNFWEMIAYNSEHIQMLMISISIFLYGRIINLSDRRQTIYLFLLGFTLGCVPFAKLQSVPIALSMAFFCGIDLFLGYKNNNKKATKTLTVFVIGGIIPSIFIFSYLFLFGIFEDFWQSYILSNLVYAQKGLSVSAVSWASKISILPLLIWTTPHTRFYFISLFISALGSSVILFRWRSSLISIDFRLAFLSFLMVLISYYSIIQPGNIFHHYQMLFILPAIFFSGILIGIVYRRQNFSVRVQRILIIIFVLIAVVFPSFYTISMGSEGMKHRNIYGQVRAYRKYAKTYGYASIYAMNIRKSEVAKKISEYAPPNQRMAIWGWMNQYYVETGLVQGTREPHSYRQISKSKQQDYYLGRYVSDLNQNRPVVFVDAVGPKSFYFNNSAQRHENFPTVRAVIEERYTFVSEIEGVRVYVLRRAGV
jgi:hypothetical protein